MLEQLIIIVEFPRKDRIFDDHKLMANKIKVMFKMKCRTIGIYLFKKYLSYEQLFSILLK